MMQYRFPIVFAAYLTLSLVPGYSYAAQLTALKTTNSALKIAQTSGNQSFESYIKQGNEAIEQEEYQKAIALFEQAVSLRPEDPTAQQGLRNAQGYAYDQYMQEGYAATRQRDYQTAREQFQQAQSVRPDDFYAQQALSNIENYQEAEIEEAQVISSWLVVGLLLVAVSVGIGLFLWLRSKGHTEEDYDLPSEGELSDPQEQPKPGLQLETAQGSKTITGINPPGQNLSPGEVDSSSATASSNEPNEPGELVEQQSLPIQQTTRLPNLDIVNELIKDLQEPDPKRRRKSIWELAQRGDSRAVKPLVAIMTDADSHERSLILAALSQICTRTLKPINQALAVSLQDENAAVRKNAIRDSTRIYDTVLQVRQLLRHAIHDEDAEVQETAQWALQQLEVIPTDLEPERLPPQENPPEEP